MPMVGNWFLYKADGRQFILLGLNYINKEGEETKISWVASTSVRPSTEDFTICQYSIQRFWELFQELPKDNLQETKEMQEDEIACHTTYVNALEDEKANRYNHTYTTPVVDLSKPEPKIDIKEERVEPASIWKDVSELCCQEIEDLVLIKNEREVFIGAMAWFDAIGEYGLVKIRINNRKSYPKIELETNVVGGYLTLTDFINSFEQMQKDIEELKKCKK